MCRKTVVRNESVAVHDATGTLADGVFFLHCGDLLTETLTERSIVAHGRTGRSPLFVPMLHGTLNESVDKFMDWTSPWSNFGTAAT